MLILGDLGALVGGDPPVIELCFDIFFISFCYLDTVFFGNPFYFWSELQNFQTNIVHKLNKHILSVVSSKVRTKYGK